MKLTEALDKPAPIKWKSKSDIYWDGEFIVGDIKYNIIFDEGSNLWEITFEAIGHTSGRDIESGKHMGLTKTGNEFIVFATVKKATIEFIKKINPKGIMFQANEPSRRKLYARFAKMIAKKYGYVVDISKGNTIMRKRL